MTSSAKNIPYYPKVKDEALCNILPSCRPGFLRFITTTFPNTVINLTVLAFVPNNLLLSRPVEKLGFRVRKSGLLSYRKKRNVSDTKQQN